MSESDSLELSTNNNRQSLLSQSESESEYIAAQQSVSINRHRGIQMKRRVSVEMQESIVASTVFSEGSEKSTKQQLPSFLQPIKQWFANIPVVAPTSPYMIGWRIFIMALIILYFYVIPIYIAWGSIFFNQLFGGIFVNAFTSVSVVIFIVDVGLQFIIAYYLHGNLIINKYKIASHYFKGYLFWDSIAIISFTFRQSLQTDDDRWVYLLFYFKLPALLNSLEDFDEMVLLYRRTRSFFQIAKIIIFLFFAFIIFGCYFNLLGHWSYSRGYKSWVGQQSNFGVIGEMDVTHQFFFSLYFSMGTLSSTMGYGDITPMNIYECTYCLGGIIFAVMFFAFIINEIFKVLEEHNVTQNKIFRNRLAINRFMKNKQVPRELCERVRQYLNEHWYEEGNRDQDLERETIESLAPELKEELLLNSYEMFSGFSRPFLKKVPYSQGETIFSDRNPNSQCNFYYIAAGSILIHPSLKDKSPNRTYINKLKAGQFFGEQAFITGLERCASAVAHSYSLVYTISREDFLATAERYPEDYEQFCMMRDRLMLNKDLEVLGTGCWTCNSTEHYSTNCPKTHFCPKIQKVLNIDIWTDRPQERMPKERKLRKPWPTRQNQVKLVKLQQGDQGLQTALKSKQAIIKRQSTLMLQSIFKQPEEHQNTEESKVQTEMEHLEMQKKFAKFIIPQILTGQLDFDKPANYKRYLIDGNVQNVWSQTGQLIRR